MGGVVGDIEGDFDGAVVGGAVGVLVQQQQQRRAAGREQKGRWASRAEREEDRVPLRGAPLAQAARGQGLRGADQKGGPAEAGGALRAQREPPAHRTARRAHAFAPRAHPAHVHRADVQLLRGLI